MRSHVDSQLCLETQNTISKTEQHTDMDSGDHVISKCVYAT